ncbi:MAG: hypothetical protein HC896_13880 [Bacteroidales bacterium]|nr:hypothetical protein [Bacteroidales bacterium]
MNVASFSNYRFVCNANAGLAQRYEWQVNDETIAVNASNANVECLVPLAANTSVIKLITETEIVPDDVTKAANQPAQYRNEIHLDVASLCPNAGELQMEIEQNPDAANNISINVSPAGGEFILLDESRTHVIGSGLPVVKGSDVPCEENKLFLLNLRDLRVPFGSYTLRYAFKGCGMFVDAKLDVFTENDNLARGERAAVAQPTVATPPASATVVLSGIGAATETRGNNLLRTMNNRANQLRLRIEALESDSTLAQTKTFGTASMFTLFAGSLTETHSRFHQATDLLFTSLKRAGDNRKEQYNELLEIITLAYLDKIVVASGSGLNAESQESLNLFSEKLRIEDITSPSMLNAWNANVLRSTGNLVAVDQILAILK